VEFDGTLLLVSHDRELLDNVVTSTLVLEGEGRVGDYIGGWSDWLRQRPGTPSAAEKPVPSATKPAAKPQPSKSAKKLSYKDQRDLEQLPSRIERLEAEREALEQRLADPALYRDGGADVSALQARIAELETALTADYARWEALEARQGQFHQSAAPTRSVAGS
jgi:ATP-binding cassette subfamily F protein uup